MSVGNRVRRADVRSRTALLLALLLAWPALFPRTARAWEWLRSANDNVEKGNGKMAAKDYPSARQSYDKAARELPSSAGVQLNRGLALMAEGKLGEARESFLRATEPPASPEVSADAYYDLGVAFYREADQMAAADDHEQAAKLFREAEDSLRRSLRIRPGHADTAWNLELAMRREKEAREKQEQKRQEQQKQQEEQDKKDQEKKEQDQQDQGQGEDKEKDGGEGEEQEGQQKEQPQEEEKKPEQKEPEQKEKQPEPPSGQQQEKKEEEEPQKEQKQASNQRPLPADVSRALDALQDSEENLERHRARVRAARERRAPDKDW